MEQWLRILHLKIAATDEHEDVFDEFKILNTDEERIKFIFELMIMHRMVPQVRGGTKSAKESIALRQKGNEKYNSKSLTSSLCIDVLKLYTKSIAYAPCSSEELALAYANRSAVLKNIHKYEECIQDIDRALALPYPNKLRSKLYLRKIECLSILKHPKIKDTVEEAQCWLEQMSLDDVSYKKMKNTFISAQTISVSNIPKKKNSTKQSFLPKLETHNPEVPCASDAVAIKYNEKYGRHIVATRDIDRGDIIAIEKPYLLMLDPDNLQTHCSNCLEVSWANIPCNYCTYAMYCSEECKASDWNKCHDIECKVFPHLVAMDFSRSYLFNARITIHIIKESKNIQNLREELKEVENCDDPRTKGFSKNGTFESNAYRSVLSLVTNIEKISFADFFRRFTEASVILYYLATYTDIFGKSLDIIELIKSNDATFVGGLIARQQLMIPANAHSFSEKYGMDTVDRGIAVMPFLSLINHSCNSNIIRISRSTHIVVHALYPIKKGEQIFDDYGQQYGMIPKAMRQKELEEQYYFTCDCVACVENWPLYHQLEEPPASSTMVRKSEVIRTLSSIIECCMGAKENFKDLMDSEEINAVLEVFLTLHKGLTMPNAATARAVEALKLLYSSTGNKFVIPEL